MSYDSRKSKLNISHTLRAFGWDIYGYKKDMSDSMTDYYDPAYWEGIAEKDGFILVLDNTNTRLSGTRERDSDRIIPEFKNPNPDNYNWHVEDSNGNIVGMGKGIFTFSDMPHEWDYVNKRCQEGRRISFGDELGQTYQRTYENNKEQVKVVDGLYKLVGNINSIVTNPTHIYEEEEEIRTRTVLDTVEVEFNAIEDGMNILLNVDFNGGLAKGNVYNLSVENDLVTGTKYNKALTKLLKGKTKGNHIRISKDNMIKQIGLKNISCVKIEKVKTEERIYQWVGRRIGSTVKPKDLIPTTKNPKNDEKEVKSLVNVELEIIKDVDTRDNSDLWVVKVKTSLNREEYLNIKGEFKELGSYYSKYKKGFLFKVDPSTTLNNIKQSSNSSSNDKEDTAQPKENNNSNTNIEIPTESGIEFDEDSWSKLDTSGFFMDLGDMDLDTLDSSDIKDQDSNDNTIEMEPNLDDPPEEDIDFTAQGTEEVETQGDIAYKQDENTEYKHTNVDNEHRTQMPVNQPEVANLKEYNTGKIETYIINIEEIGKIPVAYVSSVDNEFHYIGDFIGNPSLLEEKQFLGLIPFPTNSNPLYIPVIMEHENDKTVSFLKNELRLTGDSLKLISVQDSRNLADYLLDIHKLVTAPEVYPNYKQMDYKQYEREYRNALRYVQDIINNEGNNITSFGDK